VQRLADVVAGRFCYSVMAASAATFAFWSLLGARPASRPAHTSAAVSRRSARHAASTAAATAVSAAGTLQCANAGCKAARLPATLRLCSPTLGCAL